jgi:hypothetical protein
MSEDGAQTGPENLRPSAAAEDGTYTLSLILLGAVGLLLAVVFYRKING